MTQREKKNLVTRLTMPLQGVAVVVTNDPGYLHNTISLAEWLAKEKP